MITVVVTGVGAIIGQGIIKSLRQSQHQLRVVGVDRSDDSPGPSLSDVFYRKPKCEETDSAYLEFLDHLLRHEAVDLVLPGLEVDLYFLDNHRALVENAGAKLAINDHELINLCADKWLMRKALAHNGMRTIPTSDTTNWADAISELGAPPLLLKPRRGNGSRGIVRLQDEEDFNYWRNKAADNWMLQRIVGSDDEEYTVGLFGFGDGTGLEPIIFHRRLSAAGNTLAASVVAEPRIRSETLRLTEIFRPVGPTNYQFRLENGIPYLLEINPRISSSTSLRTSFGYNEAAMSIDFFALGQRPAPPIVKSGRAWRYSEDFVTYDRDHF
jgi:carbamoyl-phosphate synthase large subunit